MKSHSSKNYLLVGNETLYTANEINSQPEVWLNIYKQIRYDKNNILLFLDKALSSANKIILTGAGTSAHIGLSLHGIFNRSTKIHTVAIPTTDLVSHPKDHFFKDETILLISFARSGNSPESLGATSLADKLCKKCFHIIITCDPNGQLAKYNTKSTKLVLLLPQETNDKGLAMTVSYSGMLLYGFLLAQLREIEKYAGQIDILYKYGIKILELFSPKLKDISLLKFTRVVFLGSGPFYGTATESHLKLQELTDGNIICKNDSYLGFRHGPKAVTNENTLLVFIFSNNPYVQKYERDLVISMNKGKKPLFTIAIFESPIDGLKFDLEIQLSETGNQLDEELLTVCDILPAQILAFYKSLAIGLNPDSPCKSGAISRVVEDVTIYNL